MEKLGPCLGSRPGFSPLRSSHVVVIGDKGPPDWDFMWSRIYRGNRYTLPIPNPGQPSRTRSTAYCRQTGPRAWNARGGRKVMKKAKPMLCPKVAISLIIILMTFTGCDYARMYDQDSVKTYGRKMAATDKRAIPVKDGFQILSHTDPAILKNPLPHPWSRCARAARLWVFLRPMSRTRAGWERDRWSELCSSSLRSPFPLRALPDRR